MGFIRVLLALAVVLGHSGAIFGFRHIDGVIAVQSFFIISGFYMSMIIKEKYNVRNTYRLFISNRLLRLFPTYIFIILLTVIVILIFDKIGIKQEILNNFSKINLFSKIYVNIINLIIVGQDSTLFLGFNSSGSLHYMSNFYSSNPPVYTFLLCSPAWSLSLELMFYCIAPFLVKRNLYLIIILMLLSFFLRIVIYKHGHFYDPWTYRFFPTELFFFLSGNISYRLFVFLRKSKYILKHYQIWKYLGLLVLISIISEILLFNFIPIKYYIKQWLFYIIFTLAIPILFTYTKNNSVDRFIGELSYPIYLSQMLIIFYCLPIFNHFFGCYSANSLLVVVFTSAFSIFIVLIVIKPIDNYREKRVIFYKNK